MLACQRVAAGHARLWCTRAAQLHAPSTLCRSTTSPSSCWCVGWPRWCGTAATMSAQVCQGGGGLVRAAVPCALCNATVQAVRSLPHPWCPPLSPPAHYEDLMNAEEQGKKSKKGMWSSKEAPVMRVNDLSAPGSATRCAAPALRGEPPRARTLHPCTPAPPPFAHRPRPPWRARAQSQGAPAVPAARGQDAGRLRVRAVRPQDQGPHPQGLGDHHLLALGRALPPARAACCRRPPSGGGACRQPGRSRVQTRTCA